MRCARVRTDRAARVLVLTGAGRGFCAGQDLGDRAVAPGGQGVDLGESIEKYYKPLVLALRNLPMPVIAAVNGVAAGAGANIALACDLVIAARSASFVQSFSKLGLVPDSGGTWLLPRLVGNARAMGLALLGDKLSRRAGGAMGTDLALRRRRRVQADRRDTLAQQLARAPTRGLARTKQAIYESLGAHARAATRSGARFPARARPHRRTMRKASPRSPRSARRSSRAAEHARCHERSAAPSARSAPRVRCSRRITRRRRSACASLEVRAGLRAADDDGARGHGERSPACATAA